MRVQPKILWIATCGVLLGGCRTEYLASPDMLNEAWRTADRLQKSAATKAPVAVELRPVNDPGHPDPPRYVRLAKLRVDEMVPHGSWRVSARNRGSLLTAGGVLLGLGVVSLVSGGLGIYSDLNSAPSCRGDGCSGKGYFTVLVGVPMMIAGFVETIPAAILLGLGGPQIEVPTGVPGMVYVPETPGVSSSEALPAGTQGLRAGLRF